MKFDSGPLTLRSLTLADEAAFREAFAAWDHASGFTFAHGYDPALPFADYVALLEAWKRGERLPEGYVPSTALNAFVGAQLVGRLSIRHELNEFLLRLGGHIGYGVVPPFRRQGYAKEMLRLSLPLARKLGISRALVTCDDDNPGSARTIEANGGVLENVVPQGPGKPHKRRYWIQT